MTAGARGRIATAEQLARRMAAPARALRDAASAELGRSELLPSLAAARRLLTESVSAEFGCAGREGDFADALAQLAAVGLFAAWVDWGAGADESGRRHAEDEVLLEAARRQPFLNTLIPAARSLPGGADALEQLVHQLASADVEAVLAGLRRRSFARDPAAHFHELLLACYDSPTRRSRGVYCTPESVVSYLVRSVDHLLRSRFGLPNGLATGALSQPGQEHVADSAPGREAAVLRIVDPACGAGAVLSGVVDFRRRLSLERGGGAIEQDGAQRGWLQGLVGFEVLPGACAAAHFLLHRKLATCDPAKDRLPPMGGPRLPVHLANPLTEDEGRQADRLGIQRGRSILAILGNPPYSNFGRRNRGAWIQGLLEDYKRGLDEKKINLDDDFIKFIRWSQYWIDWAGAGVLAFITNNTYLTGLTHRRMRRSLSNAFDEIYVLDLHGGAGRRESAPPGVRDENIFNIQTGVAIGVFVKQRGGSRGARVFHAEHWGSRAQKHEVLANSDIAATAWNCVEHRSEEHFFAPRAAAADAEFKHYPRIDEIFRQHISGVQTKHDELLVAFTRQEVAERMRRFFSDGEPSGEPPPSGPNPSRRRLARQAAGLAYSDHFLQPYLAAPFDRRWVYYDPKLLGRARYNVMRHVLAGSPALVFMRQSTNGGQYDHFLAVNSLASDRVLLSRPRRSFLAPLYLYDGGGRSPNLASSAIQNSPIGSSSAFAPKGLAAATTPSTRATCSTTCTGCFTVLRIEPATNRRCSSTSHVFPLRRIDVYSAGCAAGASGSSPYTPLPRRRSGSGRRLSRSSATTSWRKGTQSTRRRRALAARVHPQSPATAVWGGSTLTAGSTSRDWTSRRGSSRLAAIACSPSG